MPEVGEAIIRIVPKTGHLEQELDALELQASRIQTRLEKALTDAQTLRRALERCEALQSELEK